MFVAFFSVQTRFVVSSNFLRYPSLMSPLKYPTRIVPSMYTIPIYSLQFNRCRHWRPKKTNQEKEDKRVKTLNSRLNEEILNSGYEEVVIVEFFGSKPVKKSTLEAIQIAKSKNMELLLVDAKVNPPVCKIITLEELESKKIQKVLPTGYKDKIKQVRISNNISEWDLQRKVEQIKNTLSHRYRCTVLIIFKRTREWNHDFAMALLKNIYTRIKDLSGAPPIYQANDAKSEATLQLSPNLAEVKKLEAIRLKDQQRKEGKLVPESSSTSTPNSEPLDPTVEAEEQEEEEEQKKVKRTKEKKRL